MNDDGITPDRNPVPPTPGGKRRWLPRLAALTILPADRQYFDMPAMILQEEGDIDGS